MAGIARMIAVLLVAAVCVALPGAQAWSMSAAQPSHPAGCHSHGPAVPSPSPAPVSYQCCVNGHHWAVGTAGFVLRPLAGISVRLHRGQEISVEPVPVQFVILVVPSISPPGAVPMRI
jgi:hypothetical protein